MFEAKKYCAFELNIWQNFWSSIGDEYVELQKKQSKFEFSFHRGTCMKSDFEN